MARKLIVEIVGDASSLEKSFRQAERSTTKLNRELSQTTRGVAAGSGAFKALGRSIAFASGGFIAAAGITDLLRGSIEQASEAEAVQRKLAAQFVASGQDLRRYQERIDAATTSLSRMAGIEDEELKQAFVTAFRGSNDVTTALKIQAIAADVARGRNIDLQTATLALTKAYAGQSTGLRRLGIMIPTTVKGMQALNIVQQRFRGQAEAGTTAQQRFAAAFANFEEVIGAALLPTFNKLLDQAANWMSNSENQKKVQQDVTAVVKVAAGAFGLLADAINKTASAYDFLGKHLPGGTGWSLMDLTRRLPGGNQSLLDMLGITGGGGRSVSAGMVSRGDFQLGRGPGGAAPFPAIVSPGGGRAGRTSLQGQMNRLELQLAEALTTASTADDRAILVLQRHLVNRILAHTKDWKQRRQWYGELASVQNQIQAIDDKAAAEREDVADKEKAAKQRQLDAEKQRLENHRDHIRKMRAAWQEQLQKLRQAAAGVRGEFGGLPFQQAPTGILGLPGPSAGGFVGAYAKQTSAFVNFYRNLRRLRKAGAPRGLVEQFRQAGVDTAGTTVTGLLAHPRQLKRLARLYRERERVVQQIAHADIQARIVNLHVAGSRHGATATSQRAGRTAGVISAARTAGAGSPWTH